ncbi:MAG: FHA domain-containing protein [Janthinobacterium lividum]
MTRCPHGHFTGAADYCDVCGAPLDQAAGPTGAAPAAPPSSVPAADGEATSGLEPCPNCGTPHTADALFCEGCGYDFTTGAMPRPLDPPVGIDPAPPPGPRPDAAAVTGEAGAAARTTPPVEGEPGRPDVPAPTAVARWVVEVWVDPGWYTESQSPDPLPSAGPPRTVVLTSRSALVGRPSTSRNIHPDVDCAEDTGVSRRHAQLTTDGSRFWVEDLESANGTFVATSGGPLPKNPVAVGAKQELDADDRVYVGAWTRLVVRPATEDEQA